jgi:oligopeptidase A
MDPMEEVDQLFEYGWSPVGHLLSVANSDPLREAHDAAMPKIVEFSLQLRQSEAIYRRSWLLCEIQRSGQGSAALSSVSSRG